MTHTYIHTELSKQMKTFRFDAHPMGMFIATIASLSTFHPEANPSLMGQNLYMMPKPVKSNEGILGESSIKDINKVRDIRNKQIYRILGKSATIAANAYR